METGTSRRVSYSDLKTNLLTDTAIALAALEVEVDNNRSSANNADLAQVEALETFKTYIEDRNLAAGLSLGMLYVENFSGG